MSQPARKSSLEDVLEKLEPRAIRTSLNRAGLFLVGWEMLKMEIQDKVREFFADGFDENGPMISERYHERVLGQHKSVFEASLLWLVEVGALTQEQTDRIRDLRIYRNVVAHELPKLLLEPGHDVDVARIHLMRDVIVTLGQFWGRIEVDGNADFDGRDVKDEDIQSGSMLVMELLVAAVEDDAVDVMPKSRS